MLPTLQIITAYGLIYTLQSLQSVNLKLSKLNIRPYLPATLLALCALIFSAQLFYFLHNYYVHYPAYANQEWQYGYKQMVNQLASLQANYDRIVITDNRGRPYINVLFYLKYPPDQFQTERHAFTDKGFVIVDQFNKYHFRGINWKKEIANLEADEKVLLIGTSQELREHPKYTKATIKDLNGQTVFIFNEVPTGFDALFELGFIDQFGNPIESR